MRSTGTRALVALGFSCLFALTAACGGSKPAAVAPTSDATATPRVGSDSPDLSPSSSTTPATEPVKTSAVSSTENGSDIIPPFTSGGSKETSKKSSGPAKGQKKATAKKKKGKA